MIRSWVLGNEAHENRNNVDNLEWCTTLDNLLYSNIINKASEAKITKVRCINTGKIYNSVKDATEELNLHHSNIVACCNGRRSSCGGLKWEYVN